MTALTIRTISEDSKRRLKVRAARNGRSMDAEATHIIETALASITPHKNIGQKIRERALRVGGIDLEFDPRESMPDSVSFE